MRRWSFSVYASCVTISNPGSLSSSDTGIDRGIKSWKSTSLNELDFRKPLVEPSIYTIVSLWLVVSIAQRSEELRLYKLVQNLAISNPHFNKAVSSNVSPDWTVRFWVIRSWLVRILWKRESRPIWWHPFCHLPGKLFFYLLIYSLCGGTQCCW
jgi:hypothetical protein